MSKTNPTKRPTYDGNYHGQGIYGGPGWYGKSDSGPIIHCFSHEFDKPDGPFKGKSFWFESRAEAEAYIIYAQGQGRSRNTYENRARGGKRKYSLRRRCGRKHKSRPSRASRPWPAGWIGLWEK